VLVKNPHLMTFQFHDLPNRLVLVKILACTELVHLGFIVDNELKLAPHVNKLVRIIAQGINSLFHLKESVSVSALKQFFFAHIQSHLNYCAFALLRCRASDIHRIQRMQSRALKIIFNLNNDTSERELFSKYAIGIFPINGIIYFSAISFVIKCIKCTDHSLPAIRVLKSRRSISLELAHAKKKILKDDITHSGVKLFNKLPIEIRKLYLDGSFHVEVKKHLKTHVEKLLPCSLEYKDRPLYSNLAILTKFTIFRVLT
jgi:hypothetical protein